MTKRKRPKASNHSMLKGAEIVNQYIAGQNGEIYKTLSDYEKQLIERAFNAGRDYERSIK